MKKYDRCPWCGRKITAPANPFGNTVCKQCGKKYYTYFRYIFGIVLFTPLMLMLVRYISIQLRLAILATFVIVLLCLIPFARQNMLKIMRVSPYSSVVDIPKIYVANIIVKSGECARIKKNDILLTDLDFDKVGKDGAASPVCVVWANKKSVRFYFLYDNEQTANLLDKGSFDVWRDVSVKGVCTLEIIESEQSDPMSCMPFSYCGYKDIDESRIVGVNTEGITYLDARDEKQIVNFRDCTVGEKGECIGESMIISQLSCGVVIYSYDVWARFIFSEKNRAEAMSTPNSENRYYRRDRFIAEIEKCGHKISRNKLL